MKRIVCVGSILAIAVSALPALAADLPVKAPPLVPIVVDNWTGVYIGGNFGYSWGRARTDVVATSQSIGTITTTTIGGTVLDVTTVPGPITTVGLADSRNMNGFLGGGQIGYNYKVNNWLLGIETDLQATGQKGSGFLCITAGCPTGSPVASADFRLRWFGTLRGRAGWLVDNNLLIYATGGLAYGRIGADYALSIAGTPGAIALASAGTTRTGWVIGAGGEYRVSERWSFKLEYLYMDLGSTGATFSAATTSVPIIFTVGDRRLVGVATTTNTAAVNSRFTDNILRMGVNYRF